MISLLGAVILVTASTMIGFGKASELHARARILSAVLTSLELLRGEVCTIHTPIPEIAERFSKNAPTEIRGFFKRLRVGIDSLGEQDFSEIWSSAVMNSSELSLNSEERNTLCLLGMSLGRYGADEQECAISQCVSQFERYIADARNTAKTQSKLYTGLGAAVGLMLAVMLI